MIGWLDPSISSSNTGDIVISQAVASVFARVGVPIEKVVPLPTQRRMTTTELTKAHQCNRFVVGGTNLLSSNMPWYRQWKLGLPEFRILRGKVALLGVGWWQYQGAPNAFTRHLLRSLLTEDVPHSVRDRWTARLLGTVNVNTVYTACPTMWSLAPEPEMRRTIGRRVVLTLTDYNRSPREDRALIELAENIYDEVVFWPQGSRDSGYADSLRGDVQQIPEGLRAFDEVIRDPDTDFFGTRLHAGIRALQFGRRATIVAVDNRAREIANDTGLPVVERSLPDGDCHFVQDERNVQLTLPNQEIKQWMDDLSDWLKE